MVKSLLARCVPSVPERIDFGYGRFGKPHVEAWDEKSEGLEFNSTHTEGFGACVISGRRRCGIDVERRVLLKDRSLVSQYSFSSFEQSFLALEEEAEQLRLCYRIWTLKEAYTKALGVGLSMDPSLFSVLPNADGTAKVFGRVGEIGLDGDHWSLFWFDLFDRYHCAVAVEGSSVDLAVLISDLCADGY
jgi:4'-phosphopantetheinyl transferase